MSWINLMIAIVFEVAGTTCMKMSDGLTRLWPSMGIFTFYIIAFIFLTLALKKIDISVAYAIWCGTGIVLITCIDIFAFKAHLPIIKIASIGLILMGTVLLKVIKS